MKSDMCGNFPENAFGNSVIRELNEGPNDDDLTIDDEALSKFSIAPHLLISINNWIGHRSKITNRKCDRIHHFM